MPVTVHTLRVSLKRFRWSPELDQQLVDLHARGYHDGRIALALGVSRDTVRRYRLALGLPPWPRYPDHRGDLHPYRQRLRLDALARCWTQASTPREADIVDALDDCTAVAPAGPWLPVWVIACLTGQSDVRDRLRQRLCRLHAAGALEVRHASRLCGGVRLLVRIAQGVQDRFGRLAGTPKGKELPNGD